ncbi:MAG: hypothetical protein GY757_28940, partial [bacterium]|nr:hypothetical protein [bacterium]
VTPIWKQREKYQINGSRFEWSHATMNSQKASEIIDDIFVSIEKPIWIPQYNFEFDGVFHLLHRGFSLEQIKQFIKAFNEGIKTKIKDPSKKELPFDVLKQLRKSIQTADGGEDKNRAKKDTDLVENYDADFDF